MLPLDTSTPELIEKKLSLLRRYLVEIVIIILASCIVYLFHSQNVQEELLIQYYKTDKGHDQETINRMNGIIENNNVILITLKGLIQEMHEQEMNHTIYKQRTDKVTQ